MAEGSLGKVRKIPRCIACHQVMASDNRVGADEKIWQRQSLYPALPPIGQERLAREEGRDRR